jgi:hypothetical protein
MKGKEKPSGLGALSPFRAFTTSQTSLSSKTFHPSSLLNTNRIKRKTIQFRSPIELHWIMISVKLQNMLFNSCSIWRNRAINNKWFNNVVPFVWINDTVEDFIFLSSSLNQSALDCFLQLTSSKRIVLSRSLVISAFLNLLWSAKDLPSTITSRSQSPSWRIFFLLLISARHLIPFSQVNFQSFQFIRQVITRGALKTRHPPLFHLFPQIPLI